MLHTPQMGYPQIAHYLDISLTTLWCTIARADQEGNESKGRGRHPETTQLQDEAMMDDALNDRNTAYIEIAKKVAPNVSSKTVRRRLAQKHLKTWIAPERVHLDEDLAPERREWALAHRHWTREIWRRKAMWGDAVADKRRRKRKTSYLDCNKHIPVGVSLNGERLIVVHIVIIDYLHSLVQGSLIAIRPEGTKSNR